MNTKQLTLILFSFTAFGILNLVATEIYVGEPLGEALFDLVKTDAILVADDLVFASTTSRVDVFRLPDKRLLAITSKSQKLGEPYTVESLQITSSSKSSLNKQLPSVATIKLPSE